MVSWPSLPSGNVFRPRPNWRKERLDLVIVQMLLPLGRGLWRHRGAMGDAQRGDPVQLHRHVLGVGQLAFGGRAKGRHGRAIGVQSFPDDAFDQAAHHRVALEIALPIRHWPAATGTERLIEPGRLHGDHLLELFLRRAELFLGGLGLIVIARGQALDHRAIGIVQDHRQVIAQPRAIGLFVRADGQVQMAVIVKARRGHDPIGQLIHRPVLALRDGVHQLSGKGLHALLPMPRCGGDDHLQRDRIALGGQDLQKRARLACPAAMVFQKGAHTLGKPLRRHAGGEAQHALGCGAGIQILRLHAVEQLRIGLVPRGVLRPVFHEVLMGDVDIGLGMSIGLSVRGSGWCRTPPSFQKSNLTEPPSSRIPADPGIFRTKCCRRVV